MKKLVLVLLLMCPAALMGATKTEVFPLTVHVTASKWVVQAENSTRGSSAGVFMQINVVISGKNYELIANPTRSEGLLLPGDYKAGLIKNTHYYPPYEVDQTYVLQFPDGKAQKFTLEGISQ